jgi:probable F420-dependent oxidoreductase
MTSSKAKTDLESKFGTYVLPGRVTDPARGIQETIDAERVGLGTAWLSERFALKDAPTLNGAMVQATSRIGIGGTTYCMNRHPLTLATYMSTMQALSGDRFSLIIARCFKELLAQWGMPWSSFALMRDLVDIIQRLLAGETVSYHGPAGNYPELKLVDRYHGQTPRMILTAIGPQTLAFAGAHFDGVLLHPLLTPDTVSKMAAIVHESAEKAGRDPASVRIIANVIAAPDLSADDEEAIVGGRAVTYLHTPGYGESLVKANGWDQKGLEKLRAHPTFSQLKDEMADQAFTRQQLVESSRALPREWLASSVASGSADQCADQLKTFIDAGADEIILHGSAPAQFEKLVGSLKRHYPN